jgi:hypothetical protein
VAPVQYQPWVLIDWRRVLPRLACESLDLEGPCEYAKAVLGVVAQT